MEIPTPHDQARAEEALRLLEGPVFSAAMEGARATFIREWEAAETVDERERAWASVHALREVQRQLRRIVSRGTVAGAQ